MKINWGWSIVIAFGLFMAFILYFVFKVQSDRKYDNELVIDDYYKQERLLQNQIEKEQNAMNLDVALEIKNNTDSIVVVFPSMFKPENIKGKVSLYRPSNQKLDFEIPISITVPYLLIPKSDLAGGRWDITIEWEYDGKGYINKKELML